MKGDALWFDDVQVLWRRPLEFFPAADQTPAERVNALVRLVVYASLAAFAYNRQPRTLVLGGAAIAVVSLAFRGSDKDSYPVSARDSAQPVTTAQASTAQCTKPTKDNPFANVLLTDLAQNVNRPPACAYDDVKDEIRDHFNTGLIRDVGDVYQVQNSQRQYHTMPCSTGIPDTQAFANFLYGGMTSCHDDQSACRPLTG